MSFDAVNLFCVVVALPAVLDRFPPIAVPIDYNSRRMQDGWLSLRSDLRPSGPSSEVVQSIFQRLLFE
jgi:hypothetical protein